MKKLILIDAQNDFISGSLPTQNGENVLSRIIKYLNNNKDIEVRYSLDWHSMTNTSFKINGGIWPVHCVSGEDGANLHKLLYKLDNKPQRPNDINLYYKGIHDEIEEYSAYYAKNDLNKSLFQEFNKSDEIVIIGFALEYCVKHTILDFLNNGYTNLEVIPELCGYVSQGDYEKSIIELRNKGIKITTL